MKTLLFLSFGLLFSVFLLAEKQCFLAVENHRVIVQEGDYKLRHAPCSTFKIALSLMGYHEGLLSDEFHPELPFREGYVDYIQVWKQTHNPSLWIKNSCIWYSQLLTQQLGMNKLKSYVARFNYGNKDVSGDKGQNNGLTRSWLSSSLEISPEEQVAFLLKLISNQLPVSIKSHEMTKKLLFVEDLPAGWKLYAKTGSGFLLNCERDAKLDLQMGWYIGWIEKDHRAIVFAQYLEDEEKQDTFASFRAKAAAKEKLLKLLHNSV